MPPCFDVYVWVRTDDRSGVLSRFIDRYVDTERPGDPRYDAFVRTFIARDPASGDRTALAELRRDDLARKAFTLYLRGKAHHGAIVTITEEGEVVLGLELDDPNNDAQTIPQAAAVMASLREEFGAECGVAGVELAPPQSASEWNSDALVMLREGSLPTS